MRCRCSIWRSWLVMTDEMSVSQILFEKINAAAAYERKQTLCGNAPNDARSAKRTRATTVARLRQLLTSTSSRRTRGSANSFAASGPFCAASCPMRPKRSHGPCPPTGRTITSFTLRRRRSTSGCIRALRRLSVLAGSWRKPGSSTARDRSRSHIRIRCRST